MINRRDSARRNNVHKNDLFIKYEQCIFTNK